MKKNKYLYDLIKNKYLYDLNKTPGLNKNVKLSTYVSLYGLPLLLLIYNYNYNL